LQDEDCGKEKSQYRHPFKIASAFHGSRNRIQMPTPTGIAEGIAVAKQSPKH